MLSFRMPWQTSTLPGYLLCSLVQVIDATGMTIVFTTILIMIVGLCILVVDFVSDLEENLVQINGMIEGKITHAQERIDLIKKLCETIRFHSEAKA